MVEATQKKLREAQFFLRKLQSETSKAVRPEPEAVECFLSACITAGRSVTFALQVEEKERYDAWFPGWKQNLPEEQREFLDFMVLQRNNVQKRGGADVDTSQEYVSVAEIPRNTTHPAYGFFWSGLPGMSPPLVGKELHHFTLEDSDAEVAKTCARYVELLEQLVHDFIGEFGPSESAR